MLINCYSFILNTLDHQNAFKFLYIPVIMSKLVMKAVVRAVLMVSRFRIKVKLSLYGYDDDIDDDGKYDVDENHGDDSNGVLSPPPFPSEFFA